MLTAAGFHVETINAAVPGYTSENARALFETELSRFDADYFFVYLGWNDLFHYGPESLPLERVERAGYQLNPIQRVLSHVYSLRMLFATEFLLSRYQPTVNAALDERERTLYDNYRPQHFYNNLHAILRLAKKRYPHVYVMTMATITNGSPTPDELRKAHFPKGMSKNVHKLDIAVTAYNEAIRTVARDEDVPVLDFFDLFNSHESRTLLVDSCHFLPKGAARAARLIANEIEAREPPRMAAVEH
jgi:lysophospholipase L1-like esterase